MRKLFWILAAAMLGLLGAREAQAQSSQPRIAFVAGYGSYVKGPLKSALNDAGLVSEALRSIGFDVVEAAEPSQADFQRGYRDFLSRLEAAGKDAIAFVYLSGYGVSLEGENYLLPSDARIERESDVLANAIRISELLRPLASAPLRIRVLVIDAARPLLFRLPGRPVAPGLEAIQAPVGTLVALSSGPGTVAEDGPEAYGLYAVAIAEMLRESGRDLDGIFTRIRARTHQATQGRRTPWHSAAISDPLIVVPAEPAAAPALPPREQRGSRPMRDVGPDEAYALAIELDSIEGYAEFLEAYPRHPYGRRLFQLIRSRREALAWLRANQVNNTPSYWTYLRLYPRGLYAFDAGRKLRGLGAANTPPADFTPIEFDDVPPPLPGEPEDYIGGYDDAPAPPGVLIGAAPSLFQNLPAPRARRGALPLTVLIPVNPKFTAGRRLPIAVTASAPAVAAPADPPPSPEVRVAPQEPANAALPSNPPATPSAAPKPEPRRTAPKPERRASPQPAEPQTPGTRPVPDTRRPPPRVEPAPQQGPQSGPATCEIVNGMRFCRW